MRYKLFLSAIVLLVATLNSANSEAQRASKKTHVTISGCLNKLHDDYELVDQKGVHNLVYKSDHFDLEPYVGKSVTLVGDRSAMPSTDTATPRPMPHFVVKELRPGTGSCDR